MKKIITLLFALAVALPALSQKSDVDKKLKDLNIELFAPPKPLANYVRAVRTGNLVYLAGHGPTKADGSNITGKLGKDMTVEQGYEAARQTGIALLSSLKGEIGDLNKVKRIVKVLGMVNCTPEFTDQPKVINGFSDLMVAVFGEKGKHARSAVGMISLPNGIAVEVEMIVEVEN
jgi:enamine deaminase RidA (YjgF/YER057c/UK114 family)